MLTFIRGSACLCYEKFARTVGVVKLHQVVQKDSRCVVTWRGAFTLRDQGIDRALHD